MIFRVFCWISVFPYESWSIPRQMALTHRLYDLERPSACWDKAPHRYHRYWMRYKHFIRFFLVKINEKQSGKLFRVKKSENTPKCDIVDTYPHASCAPGIIRTNNMVFLLYGSGLEGKWHNETKHFRIFGHYGYWVKGIECICWWISKDVMGALQSIN